LGKGNPVVPRLKTGNYKLKMCGQNKQINKATGNRGIMAAFVSREMWVVAAACRICIQMMKLLLQFLIQAVPGAPGRGSAFSQSVPDPLF
jgi:hypothetical protein